MKHDMPHFKLETSHTILLQDSDTELSLASFPGIPSFCTRLPSHVGSKVTMNLQGSSCIEYNQVVQIMARFSFHIMHIWHMWLYELRVVHGNSTQVYVNGNTKRRNSYKKYMK